MKPVRCQQCGGAVAVVPGQEMPACLFCGASARELVPFDPPETVEPPVGWLPFAVDEATARTAFQTFAKSSFWYPNDLRQATLELKRLLLPAWAWSGTCETHWAGLVRASTSSGKAPVAGRETVRFDQILVPSSSALSQAELRQLGRYDERGLAGFDPDAATDPFELGQMTRSIARSRAVDEMQRRHEGSIAASHGTVKLNASSICDGLDGKPVLVPVWIGAYRYRDRVYRVLVHGQTGRLLGTAPTSWWKVLGVTFGVVLALSAIVLAVLLCMGAGTGALVLSR